MDLGAPLVDEETALLSLQNGVIKDLILKARFGNKAVLGGVGYIATAIVRPGVIGQTGSLKRIILGEYDASTSQRVTPHVYSFASTGLDAPPPSVTNRTRTTKGVILAGIAAPTALTRRHTRTTRHPP